MATKRKTDKITKDIVDIDKIDSVIKDVKEENIEKTTIIDVIDNTKEKQTKSQKVISLNIPRFSIIIPCYNNAGYIVRCLRSIKKQTFDLSKVQVIVVDDASTDGSKDILDLMGDELPNFIIVHNDKNVGAGAARNIGLTHAVGKYIYYMDCDDYITEKALERIDEALAKANDPDFVLVPADIVKPGGVSKYRPKGDKMEEVFTSCPPGPPAKAFKRSLAVPFPVGFRAEDTVWHFVQLDKFDTYAIVEGDEACYIYDRTNTSAITDTAEWSSQNILTLEHLAKENDAIKAGKNDKFFSDVLRAIAAMYDSRHLIKKPLVRALWFNRFRSMYQGMVCGRFHN